MIWHDPKVGFFSRQPLTASLTVPIAPRQSCRPDANGPGKLKISLAQPEKILCGNVVRHTDMNGFYVTAFDSAGFHTTKRGLERVTRNQDVLVSGANNATGYLAGGSVASDAKEPDRTGAHPALAFQKMVHQTVCLLEPDEWLRRIRPIFQYSAAVARQYPGRGFFTRIAV